MIDLLQARRSAGGPLVTCTRRKIIAGLGLLGLDALTSPFLKQASGSSLMRTSSTNPVSGGCPFRLAVINDEITQDFEKACQIVAGDFGLQWIELRSMWNKNVTELNAKELSDAQKILEEHNLRVTDIASPLFKTDWPGAPRSSQSEARDQFHANFDAGAQDKLLETCISLAHTFNTDRIRCFDFWRLDDPKPYRAAINAKLQQAAERCAKDNIILLLENEMSCNTATGEESAAVLAAIPNKNFMLNWDPGNAAGSWRALLTPTATKSTQRSHRPLPLQRCGAEARSQIRMGGRRGGYGGLGWATAGVAARRFSLWTKP